MVVVVDRHGLHQSILQRWSSWGGVWTRRVITHDAAETASSARLSIDADGDDVDLISADDRCSCAA